MSDTIAAIASPPGRAARAVVRLSGPGVADALATLLDHDPARRGAYTSRLRLNEALSLPVLVLRFVAPSSYTSEDAAELLLPGSSALARRVLDRLLALDGVRAAEPGEFSARAYLNGRLTIEQGEGVARLIAAETDAQLDAARDLLAGRIGETYRAWANELTDLLALVEAGIDFTDHEDVTPIEPRELHARLGALRVSIENALSGANPTASDPEGPLVVLVGAPNAGKSTLFNALLGRPRAVVSERAGTTRDALIEPLDLSRDAPDAAIVRLADLPGLDPHTSGAIDGRAQHAALDNIAKADALIQCDPTGRFAPIAEARPNTPTIRVRTKADLPATSTTSNASRGVAIEVCALDGYHLSALRRAIADVAFASGAPNLVPRHRGALARASRALGEAMTLSGDDSPDPAPTAGAMRDALDALGELCGRISPDDVIARVFATFCVGK
ncbi:MAG: GTPase [Phycisphaerales bacterium]